MPSWLCVETNFHVDRLSPNEGWPFCVQSGTKPNYIRVHGPYEDDNPLGLFGSEKCDNFKIIPSNTEYPSDDKYPEQKANPLVVNIKLGTQQKNFIESFDSLSPEAKIEYFVKIKHLL